MIKASLQTNFYKTMTAVEQLTKDEKTISSRVIHDDASAVQFVNHILQEAIKRGASDIHIEPYEEMFRIRYRQDGLLNEIASPPLHTYARVAARIKIMSCLDITEKRLPQDGRFNLRLSPTQTIDFRVNTCPTIAGEKIVIRILDPQSIKLGIEELGFSAPQKMHFTEAITRPQGMILITGPTGSGKTVTLYTALNKLNTTEKNISTAEDPVEIKLPGINQVNINLKTGLTFAETLRSLLRQDPDIIMVGEIRDLETAEVAVNAAQTGHLVLSTLHTNSAAETLTRLLNMGIPRYNLISAIRLIIAQRLVRRLCNNCKSIRDDLTTQQLMVLGFTGAETLYKANSCQQCTQGYYGQIGVFEVMPLSIALKELMLTGGTTLDLLKQAQRENMLTLYQAGLEKVKEGVTTLEEINRVTVD